MRRNWTTLVTGLVLISALAFTAGPTIRGLVLHSDQAAGSNAFEFETNGARGDYGTGASDYIISDGTNLSTPSGFTAAALTSTGSFTCTGCVGDSALANNYSGVGACAANSFVSTLNDNAAPTCTAIAATVAETADYYLLPEGRVTGNATRVAQTTFEGASYFLRRDVTFNRIVFRITGQAGAPTVRILIFQATNGVSGVASRVATVTALAIGAAGNFAATPTEGSVTLPAGIIYVLYGRDSAAGSATFRTYTTQAVDLLTANVDTDTHPTSFTTTIAATTSPATFDPRQAATGEATGTSTDVIGVFRLKTL